MSTTAPTARTTARTTAQPAAQAAAQAAASPAARPAAQSAARALIAPVGAALRIALVAALCATIAAPGAVARDGAGERAPTPRPPATITETPVFQQAALHAQLTIISAQLRTGDLVGAVLALRALSQRHPALYDLHLARARLLTRAGAAQLALDALTAAADAGFADARIADAPDFAALSRDPAFVALIERVRNAAPLAPLPARAPAVPGQITDGAALVTAQDTVWSSEAQALVSSFAPMPARPGPATRLSGPGADLLNRLVREGAAAGPRGDFYDNRDGEHSSLRRNEAPGITRITYGPEAAELSRGIKGAHLFGGPTIGNSSTAVTGGPYWRSMTRIALTEPGGADGLFRQYRRNQLYVYPEHKDHDPFFGDVFPAQTPYALTTQGSSGSDRPFLIALSMALAALKPEVKADLIARGLIAPTLQMLIRRSMDAIVSDADYLSPRAHPAAFAADTLDRARLVARANALDLATIPPPTVLRLISELRPTDRIELFGDAYREAFIDTPHAIARIARGAYGERVMRLSAASTVDPNGRGLRFHWRVLSGGAKGVTITEAASGGAEVEIVIPWQSDLTAPGRPDLRTHRLDVMAVADNGAELGAPAFVSVLFPPRQVTEFDGARPLSITYDAVSRLDEYQDPRIFPLREWRDDYSYDDQKRLLGWTRTHQDGTIEAFTRNGALVEERDDRGRPLLARMVGYPTAAAPNGWRRVAAAPLASRLRYTYDGPGDRLGIATPEAAPVPSADR
jgi:hypothetical protein